MNKKISIIVPVYNVEKYIDKCLKSLVSQDYDNYDVFVINDGSTFNEQVIIDKYKNKYPKKIKSIIKENGGYGSVLERGFLEADGEYVLVCDSDDYLAPNALSTLMEYRDKTDADLVVGAKTLVYSNSEKQEYDPSFNSDFGTLNDGQIYENGSKEFEMLYFLEPSPHAKLYKREIVRRIIFPHKVSYTDNLLYFYTLTRVNKVTYCAKALSYYLIFREGNTRTDLKPSVIDAWVSVFKSILGQTYNADEMFYYRMFEGFYSVFYKVEDIKCDKETKLKKYDEVYTILERLIPYKEEILLKNSEYQKDTPAMLKQKENLLTSSSSKNTYKALVKKKIEGSIKDKAKRFIQDGPFSKIYDVYHFHAKYEKTKNDERIVLHEGVNCEPLFSEEKTCFFGYYDKPCIEYQKAIAHRVNSNSLDYNQTIDILVDGKRVSSSRAWNWQQGCQTTWFNIRSIIHNDFDGKKYISKIVDINTLDYRVINFPIYSLSKDKTFALSLNFSRLAKLRKDYGYFNLPYDDLMDDKKDGIFYVDIRKNSSELFLSLDEIKHFRPKANMEGAVHKVNHIDISPNDKRAIFLHRWFKNKKKYTRLLCVDLATKKLTLLCDNDMVSHMTWVNNSKVFGYLRGKNNKDGYFFIDMHGNQRQLVHDLLKDDGHPTVYDERYIVTDTYPDYTCKSKLLLIDTKNEEVSVIGEFYSGKKYQNDKRCDLHPRRDQYGLTIDSVALGKRNIFKIDISKMIETKK